MGRKYKKEEDVHNICERLEEGESVSSIHKDY